MSAVFVREYQEAVLRLDQTGEIPVSIPELESILRDRGLSLALKDGAPVLRGDRQQATEALMNCLKVHKREIVEHLRKQQEETPVG